jgi:hypothetical protein
MPILVFSFVAMTALLYSLSATSGY